MDRGAWWATDYVVKKELDMTNITNTFIFKGLFKAFSKDLPSYPVHSRAKSLLLFF